MTLIDVQRAIYALDPVAFAEECLGFEPDETQAKVLRSRSKRMLLNCTRQWGKSTVTAVVAVHRAFFVPGALILAVSRSERQAGEFIQKARQFVAMLGLPVRGDGINPLSILLPGSSRIVGLPGVEETGRCFSKVSLLIIDEAAVVHEQTYHMLRPMLAASGGDAWLLSTPRGKSGFFFRLWETGGARWTRFSVPATACPRISPEFLAEELEELGEFRFRREYLCEFIQPEDALFREEDLSACLSDEDPLPVAA